MIGNASPGAQPPPLKSGAWLDTLLPGYATLRTYELRWLRVDLAAGLVLTAMLIPQGMAYAALAGLPPIVGLYATAVPYNQYSIAPEGVTGADGAAILTMNQLRGFPAARQQELLVVFARARKPGEPPDRFLVEPRECDADIGEQSHAADQIEQ